MHQTDSITLSNLVACMHLLKWDMVHSLMRVLIWLQVAKDHSFFPMQGTECFFLQTQWIFKTWHSCLHVNKARTTNKASNLTYLPSVVKDGTPACYQSASSCYGYKVRKYAFSPVVQGLHMSLLKLWILYTGQEMHTKEINSVLDHNDS